MIQSEGLLYDTVFRVLKSDGFTELTMAKRQVNSASIGNRSVSRGITAPLSVVDRTANRLREAIEQGRWGPGERLPAVRQLAGLLEVSGNSIMAALSLLEHQGLVVRDARRGIFVCEEKGANWRTGPICVLSYLLSPGHDRETWGSRVAAGCVGALRAAEMPCEVIEPPPAEPGFAQLRAWVVQHASLYAGFVVCFAAWSEPELHELVEQIGTPVVQVGRHGHASRHNYVSIDYFGAGSLAAAQVLDRLPGPFLVLSSPATHDFPRRQLALGFIDGLQGPRRLAVNVTVLPVEEDGVEGGHRVFTSYLKSVSQPPRAVFGVGDTIPIGAMRAALEHGLKVPEQVAFIGSAGLEMARVCNPTLAHVHQPMDQIGQQAAEMIRSMIRLRRPWLPGIELIASWEPGGSTAPAT